jgi:hypothetical protein
MDLIPVIELSNAKKATTDSSGTYSLVLLHFTVVYS